MAHQTQRDFCLYVKHKFPTYFKNTKVIDFGSLDINGSNKEYFDSSEYTGLDIGPGKNVDIVSKAHEYKAPDNTYDVVVSTEMFEHDMFLHLSLVNMIRVLKSGGLFFFTCAGPGRDEHGTRRTSPSDSPFTTTNEEWADFYENVSEERFRKIIDVEKTFSEFEFSLASGWGKPDADLRFYGIKK